MGRRVLVTGLGTFWGGRVAQRLEADPSVEVIVGLDREEPTVALERTEYVRTDESYSILSRIVKATKVDTIVHTFLMMDSSGMNSRRIHEINVIGTMNMFAAASVPGSTVRTVAVKSSTLVYGSNASDPNVFLEEHTRSAPARTAVERSLVEVEGYVHDFAEDNPHVTVSMLRFSNVLGAEIRTPLSKALTLPVVPRIFGFDPRFQFVHEDDVIRAILFALDRNLAGIYNVAGDGMLPWSEVAAICGKQTFPLPPFGFRGIVSAPLSRLGIELTPELMNLMRYGRGVDNRRLKKAGFEFGYTSAGAVEAFAEAVRLRRTVGNRRHNYRYERDVEQFLRHSPAVVRDDR